MALVLAPAFGDAGGVGVGAGAPLSAKVLILCGSVKKCRCNTETRRQD
jgi:hypothetical protein